MYAVKATGTLRVSRAGEEEGLDLPEHGGGAYPELPAGSIHGIPMEKATPAASPVTVGAMAPAR